MRPDPTRHVTRRSFLRIAAIAGAAGSLPFIAACGQQAPPAAPTKPAAEATTAPAGLAAGATAPAAATAAQPAATAPAAAAQATAAPKPAGKAAAITLITSSDDRPWVEYVGKQFQQLRGGALQPITQAYDATHNTTRSPPPSPAAATSMS